MRKEPILGRDGGRRVGWWEEEGAGGSYRAGPLAGEDWQKRKRISFTLRDRLDRHAIAAGAFASLLFLDPSLLFLNCGMGIGEMPRRMNGLTSCGRLVGSTPSDH
jgi:hypothetical protein